MIGIDPSAGGNIEVEVEIAPTRGPRGGDLTNPRQNPPARRAHLNAPIYANGVLGLHTSKPDVARPGLVSEQPWHRLAAEAMLAGSSNIDIAAAANVEPQTISVLRAQVWFQELLATLAAQKPMGLTGLLQGEAVAALERVVEIAQNAESDRVKLAANMFLIEQHGGKAVQKVLTVHGQATYKDPREHFDSLQTELQQLRAQVGVDTTKQTSETGNEATVSSPIA